MVHKNSLTQGLFLGGVITLGGLLSSCSPASKTQEAVTVRMPYPRQFTIAPLPLPDEPSVEDGVQLVAVDDVDYLE